MAVAGDPREDLSVLDSPLLVVARGRAHLPPGAAAAAGAEARRERGGRLGAVVARPARGRWRSGRWAVRPAVGLAWAVLALVVVAALWPGLLTGRAPDGRTRCTRWPGRAPTTGSAPTSWARTCTAGWSTGLATPWPPGWGDRAGDRGRVAARGGGGDGGARGRRVGDARDRHPARLPGLLLALLVVAVLGPGTLHSTLAIAASMVPGSSGWPGRRPW
ncbi:hypothetical protein NKH77_47350 [Streptomyces sp. M19]